MKVFKQTTYANSGNLAADTSKFIFTDKSRLEVEAYYTKVGTVYSSRVEETTLDQVGSVNRPSKLEVIIF